MSTSGMEWMRANPILAKFLQEPGAQEILDTIKSFSEEYADLGAELEKIVEVQKQVEPIINMESTINDNVTEESLKKAVEAFATVQSIMSSDKNIEADANIKKIVEKVDTLKEKYEEIAEEDNIDKVSIETLKLIEEAGAEDLTTDIKKEREKDKKKKEDKIWADARKPIEDEIKCMEAIGAKTKSTAADQVDRAIADLTLWADLSDCVDRFTGEMKGHVESSVYTTIVDKKDATAVIGYVDPIKNLGTEYNDADKTNYRKRKAGDSYISYYTLPEILGPHSGDPPAPEVTLSAATKNKKLSVAKVLGIKDVRAFIKAEEAIKKTPGTTTPGDTLLSSSTEKSLVIHDDLANLKAVVTGLVKIAKDFLNNEFKNSPIIKAKLMTGGLGPVDPLKRFLSLTLAVEYAKGIKAYYDNKLEQLLAKIKNLAAKHKRQQQSSTPSTSTQPTHTPSVLVKPIASLLMYEIGEITREDEKVFSVCSDAGIPAFAALAIYLSRSIEDIKSIIKNYSKSATNIFPTILNLKRIAHSTKFRKLWHITSQQQMQILSSVYF